MSSSPPAPAPAREAPRPLLRAALVCAALAGYALVFLLLSPTLGSTVVMLGVLPVALGGCWFGRAGGLSAAAVCVALDGFLFASIGQADLLTGIPDVLAKFGVGYIVGARYDLRRDSARRVGELERTRGLLAGAEERYRDVVESASDIIYRTDLRGRFTYVNPMASQLLGYPRERLVGMSFVELVRPDHRELLLELYRGQAAGGRNVTYASFPAMRRDGRELWVGQNVQLVRDPGGEPAGFQAVARDMTAVRRAAESLERSHHELERRVAERTAELAAAEAHRRHLLAASEVVIFALTHQGGALTEWWISENLERLFGYGPEEVVSREWFMERVHPQDQAEALRMADAAFANGRGTHEFRFRRRDGEYRHVLEELRVLPPGEGTPGQVVGSWADITERHEREVHYRNLVESASDAILTVGDGGTVTFANPAVERIFGYAPRELVGTRLERLVPERRRERRRADLEAHLAAASPANAWQREEVAGVHRDGHEVPLEISFGPSTEGRQFTLVIRDLSDRERAAALVRESEELYRGLYDDSPSMLFMVDAAGAILSVNGEGARQLGYTAGELLGTAAADTFHEDDRDAARERLEECFARPGATHHWELRKRHRDGHVMWVREAVRVIARAHGEAAALVVCADVTALRHATDELRDAERRAQRVADRMRALAAAGAGVTAAQSPEELRMALHDACTGVIPFDTLLMACYRPETDTLSYLGAYDAGVWGDPMEVSVPGGPAEQVIRSRKSLLTLSSDDPRAAGAHPTGTGVRSESVIRTPLLGADGVVGLLSVQSYERGAYDDEDVEVLEALAAVAAPALLNLQLLSDVRASEAALRDARSRAESLAQRMAAVAHAASGFVGATSVEELRDTLREACARVLPIDAFTFGVHNEVEHALHFLGDLDGGAFLPALAVPLAGTPSERVVRERRTLVVASSADPASVGARLMGTGRRSESVIRTPILDGDRVLAVISVQSYTPDLYSENDVEVLETVAALTATAMVNIRLLADLRASVAALRESEARYRMLADGTHDIVSLHDAAGRFLYVSPSMEKRTGIPASELVGHTAAELMHPGDRWAARQTRRLSVDGQPTELEWRLRTRGGGYLWMNTRTAVLFDDDGGPYRLVCSSRDVTERRHAEEALRESESRFRAVFNDAGIGIILSDAEGRALEVNPALSRMLGYDADELLRKHLAELTHPDDAELDAACFGQLLAGRRDQYSLEKRYLHRDGRVVRGRLVVSLIRGEGGAPRYVMALVEDITAERQAQDALRESENQLRAIFDEAAIGIALVDMDGRPRQSNRMLRETLGYTGEDLAGLEISAFTHPEDVEADRELFAELVAGERNGYQLQKRFFRKDGAMVWGRLSVSLVRDARGRPRYAVAMVENVTEHRAAEEALEQSQQRFLQSQKMEAVGRLAGGLAHDFNNMLTAIRGNAELLLMDAVPDAPQTEDLLEIRRAADRAAELTLQLLAFSRQQLLQPRVLNLNQSVATVERMLRRLIGEDIEVATVLEPSLGQVTADPGQMEQVLLNLAVNARDAMPRGGKLWIRTDNVQLAPGDPRLGADAAPGAYVALCVADTGCGMDDAVLARIWDPFFTTKDQGKGTGLGLSTVYGIVRQSGGTVWVESELGKGTAMLAYLPRTDAPAEPEAVAVSAGPALRGAETVLVVEDEASVRRLATRVLSRSGFRVLEASDPAEALGIYALHRGELDLVLTDLVMPGMDGTRLAEILREQDPSLRVLFSTGYSADALHSGWVSPGEAILLKPFSPESLVSKVREVLDA